jgi:hypothetical protein
MAQVGAKACNDDLHCGTQRPRDAPRMRAMVGYAAHRSDARALPRMRSSCRRQKSCGLNVGIQARVGSRRRAEEKRADMLFRRRATTKSADSKRDPQRAERANKHSASSS